MFAFATQRRSRRPSLTPMIDVVFLLLVFFMLASQFGRDTALRLSGAGSGQTYAGPPRLIEVGPDLLTLNGTPIPLAELAGALAPLTTQPTDTVILRGDDGTDLQRLIDVAQLLAGAGFSNLVMVE